MSAIDRLRRQSQADGASPSAGYSDPHGRDKIRLGREMERDIGHYSFNNSSADSNGSPRRHIPEDHTRDYSMDYRAGDTETGNSNDFFPRSPAPSTHDLSKHFRDFSMHGADTSLESVEIARGAKEMGSPELDSKDFDRPAYSAKKRLVDDQDLSSQLHSPSSHGRSASLSDFGDMNRRFSPIEKFTKKNEIRERPRSAFADRYIKPSPPFQRPRNPVGRTIENERTPKLASTMPRSFKDSTQLFEELGITTAAAKSSRLDREMPKRDQSFRLPDMTGIQSLIDTTPKVGYSKRTSQKHIPIESVPLPQEEKDIITGIRKLENQVTSLTSENNRHQARIRQLESELRHTRARVNESENDMFRRSSGHDSGFGSIEDSDSALERQKASHAKDRMKLESQLIALRSKITLLETQLESEREKMRNLQEERDEAVSALVAVSDELDGLKSENKALRAEIVNLKRHIQETLKQTPSQQQKQTSAKERVKERVEMERKKEQKPKARHEHEKDESNRSFIRADEIEELRKEIRSLRESKNQSTNTEPIDRKTTAPKHATVNLPMNSDEENVQTIRIQLENATDRKDKKSQSLRRRRIRRVIVESDFSSHDDAEAESDATSDSSDQEYEDEIITKAKKTIPIQSWLHPPGTSRIPLVNSDVQKIIDGLAKHNAASCAVCARKRKPKATKNDVYSRKPLHDIHINNFTEPLYEEGESIRPSVPPKQALSTVLSQLNDEFHHLKLQYQTLTTQYEGLDPGRGKRKRKAIADKLRDVLEEFETKADQIYALYDVVEGARQEGMGSSRRDWLEL